MIYQPLNATQAKSRDDLDELLGLVEQEGSAFVMTEDLIENSSSALRVVGVLAVSRIFSQPGTLPSDFLETLEMRADLTVESDDSVRIETARLLLREYGESLRLLSPAEAVATEDFDKSVNLLVEWGEEFIVSEGSLSGGLSMAHAGLHALFIIEDAMGLGTNSEAINIVETILSDMNTPEISRQLSNVLLERYFRRLLRVANSQLLNEFEIGMNGQFADGLWDLDADNASFLSRSALAATASLLNYGDVTRVERFLAFIQSLVDTPDFNGLASLYRPDGSLPPGVGGLNIGAQTDSHTHIAMAIVHYTSITGDSQFLQMAFTLLDFVEQRLLDESFNVLTTNLLSFDIDARQSGFFRISHTQFAICTVDALSELLERRGEEEARQVQLRALGDRLTQGLTDYFWVAENGYYASLGQLTGDELILFEEADGIEFPELFNFVRGVLSPRALPGEFSKQDFALTGDHLFSASDNVGGTTITGYSIFGDSAFSQDVIQVTLSASFGLAFKDPEVGLYRMGNEVITELLEQVEVVGDGKLAREAVLNYFDAYQTLRTSDGSAWATASVSLAINGYNDHRLLSDEQIAEIQSKFIN